MRVLVTGASGLIGSALVPALREAGHEVIALVRQPPRSAGERQWNLDAVDSAPFRSTDAVVHLAGKSIAESRWTSATKAALRDSRVPVTQNLASSMVFPEGPRLLVSASAIGYYGDRGDEILTEQSAPGRGFLAGLCPDWESATAPAVQAGARVVLLRTGIVLSARGGALKKMLTPFRLGLGGRMGSGRQWMSWIALDDHVRLIQHALTTGSVRGAVNAVAPNPVINADFTRVLGEVLHRPTLFSAPVFALRLLLGEMADELLLSSQRVQPARAMANGFQFRYPELRGALAHVLA